MAQFSEIDIEFHNKLTIFTGANAVGKSTLLNIITKSFGRNPRFVSSYEKSATGSMKYTASVKVTPHKTLSFSQKICYNKPNKKTEVKSR